MQLIENWLVLQVLKARTYFVHAKQYLQQVSSFTCTFAIECVMQVRHNHYIMV